MARKSLSALDVQAAEFIALTEYQHELAKDTYEAQDEETQKVIDKIVSVLAQYSAGSKLRVTEEHVEMALFVIAVEIVKDLALLDIRVGSFTFPSTICVKCGEEV